MSQSIVVPPSPMARAYAGAALVGFALYFNVPYALLAGMFDYPGILRRPPSEVLEAFAAGGAPLIAVWYLFALAAVAFIPLALLLRTLILTPAGRPSTGLAVLGVLAGLLQALGLIRWVFVVPMLAAVEVDPAASESVREAARIAFSMLHQYAGVALGEHLGQLFTAAWVGGLGWLQLRTGARITGAIGLVSAAAILAGLVEGFATVLPLDIGILGFASIVGFLLLTVWLIATGAGFMIGRRGKGASPHNPAPMPH